jgi:hypothetical protein
MQERPAEDRDWGGRNLLFGPTGLHRLSALSEDLSSEIQEHSHQRGLGSVQTK